MGLQRLANLTHCQSENVSKLSIHSTGKKGQFGNKTFVFIMLIFCTCNIFKLLQSFKGTVSQVFFYPPIFFLRN